MKGIFLSVEGVDCAGKDTVLDALKHVKRHHGDWVFTREPGGTPIAEEIRELLIRNANSLSAEAETLLAWASRNEHIQKVIGPYLAEGRTVVSSRYFDSTDVYQGVKGADKDFLYYMKRYCNTYEGRQVIPNGTIILDISVEESLRRKAQRNLDYDIENDDFEERDRVFFQTARLFYLAAARCNPERIIVLNCEAPKQDVISAFLAASEWVTTGQHPAEFEHPLRRTDLAEIMQSIDEDIHENQAVSSNSEPECAAT